MNATFEDTVILGTDAEPQDAQGTLRRLHRTCHAAAIALAALALVLLGLVVAGVVESFEAGSWPVAVFALALGSIVLAQAGLWLRQRADIALGLIDGMTGLRNRRGMAVAGDALLAQCRAGDLPLTVVVLDFDDLAEVRSIYGREISHKVLVRVVRKVVAAAGARGLAARTGKTQFTLVLPGMNRERAQAQIQRVMGKPCRVEFDAGDSEVVLVPDILAETAAPDGETVDKLFQEVSDGIGQMRMEEARRQHWLQRERERHSRPASLSASVPAPAPIAPTMPAPLPRS